MTDLDRLESLRLLEQAWALLSQGQRESARAFALQASRLDPGAEGPWLILAALGTPDESVQYLQKVLEINPENPRAVQGLQWARRRVIKQNRERTSLQPAVTPVPAGPPARLPGRDDPEKGWIAAGAPSARLHETRPVPINPALPGQPEAPPHGKEETQPVAVGKQAEKKPGETRPARAGQTPSPSRGKIAAGMAAGLVLCLFLSAAVVIPFSNLFFPSLAAAGASGGAASPVLALLTEEPQAGSPASQPTGAPAAVESEAGGITAVPSPDGMPTITYAPTFTPLPTRTPVFTSTPAPTETPVNTGTPPPTVEAVPVLQSELLTVNHEFSGRWIDVDLANQMVYAYEDDRVVREFLVSTGIAAHPTVTGQFHIYLKYRFDDMIGPGYYLRDVPYVMYFYKGYGLHGTFWHDNFGTPMSHGCVNMRTDEAAWLYDFAPMGTLVNVH